MSEQRHIAVIGAGPGGYVAAIRAAQRCASVALIEKITVGGTCLNRGCIPSKALIAAAKRYHILKSASRWGFSTGDILFDWKAIVKRKDQVVSQLVRGIEFLLRKNKINLLRGTARLANAHEITVETADGARTLQADKIILATGSETASIPAFPIDRKLIVTSDEALSWETLPQSLLIVGGGVIGCEFAMLFAAFGVKVIIIEALPSLLALASLDSAIIKRLDAIMKKAGIDVRVNSRLKGIVPNQTFDGVTATFEDDATLQAEKALICIGRRPVTSGLGLGEAGIALTSKGAVPVNEKMQTNVPHIYAIGDMTGQWQLAHVASHQGIVAAENAAGSDEAVFKSNVIPSCIFTEPPIASVGMSEKEAAEKGITTVIGEFPYRALGKAIATDESEGMVKVIAEKEGGRILGAHLMGEGAPEMIHEIAVAIRLGARAADLMETIHAHPTFSESIPEACESIYGIGIHT